MRILVCTETRHGELDPVSLEMIAVARLIAGQTGEVTALLVGDTLEAAAARLGAANHLVAATHPDLAIATAEVYARIARDVIEAKAPDLVIVAYSATGLDVAPELSARTGRPLVAYVTAVEADGPTVTARSQIYGGKLVATTKLSAPAILMVNPGAFVEAASSPISPGAVSIHDVSPSLTDRKVVLVREDLPDFADVDLTKAERIVCVGRGIGDQAGIELARDLADLLGAEIAGSRPVVDNGWLPKLRQVGKSGQKVKPKLYLALGVSGAPEHIEGMARSDLIVAVNTDANAPIFNFAHYGATCDLFDLIASLSERLREAKAA
jgi:electron transfer flavoprotein alpha subunit